jgi:hypothetical protein
LKKRYHSFSRQSTCETASADCGSSNDKSSGQAFVAEKVGVAADVAEVAEKKDNSDTVSHSCSNCNDLQVKVDTLSDQNQKLIAEGTELVSMLKSYEQEISSLKSKVNELTQIIDVARQTAEDKNNEPTDCVPSTSVIVDPITVDLPKSPVSLKESVGSNSTPHKVDEDTKDETVKTSKKGSSLKSSRKRFQKKWSCFRCHNKGHVASCCPLKKNKSQNKVVKDGNRVGSNNNVQPSSQTKQPNSQSKPSTSGRFDRPRNISSRISHFSGKSNRFQKNNFGFQNRYQNSGYRNFQRKNEYRSFSNSNVQNNPRFFRKSDNEN